MTLTGKLLATAGVAVLAFSLTGCEKLRARDHLNKGVAQFKSAKYAEAVEHFKQAVQLDPNYPVARLYLATAYFSQYIPGAESPENVQNAKAAEQHFMEVLERDPNNTVAIKSMASLKFNQAQGMKPEEKLAKLEEARKWHERMISVDAKDKESYYSLGVITWGQWYPELAGARAKLGMKPEDPGPIKDNKVREELKAKWLDKVNKGIENLQKALEIDPEYDDAMAYMNLLIRERADLAESPDQYKKDVDTADNWVQKTMETKRIKAERAAQKGGGGIAAQ